MYVGSATVRFWNQNMPPSDILSTGKLHILFIPINAEIKTGNYKRKKKNCLSLREPLNF